MIKFNQKDWSKPYIDMNTALRQKAKNDFEKDFFKNLYENMYENVKKYRNIKLVTTKKRKNYLVSEPNYYATQIVTENLLAIETLLMNLVQKLLINKRANLGLSILDLSETVIYVFLYDY